MIWKMTLRKLRTSQIVNWKSYLSVVRVLAVFSWPWESSVCVSWCESCPVCPWSRPSSWPLPGSPSSHLSEQRSYRTWQERREGYWEFQQVKICFVTPAFWSHEFCASDHPGGSARPSSLSPRSSTASREGRNNSPGMFSWTQGFSVSLYYLEEESETNPLVIFVFHNLIFHGDRAHTRVGHFLANLRIEQLREGEGGVYPAVGVHHTLRYNLSNISR